MDSFESLSDSVVEHLSLISSFPCVFIFRVPLVNLLNHLLRYLLLVELLYDFEIARLFCSQLFYRRHRDDPLMDRLSWARRRLKEGLLFRYTLLWL